MENLLNQSFQDLRNDFEELKYLYSDYLHKLTDFSHEIEKQKINIDSFAEIKHYSETYQHELKTNLANIENDILKTTKLSTEKDLKYFINKKIKYFDSLRTMIGIYSALITSSDWQSPTFNHSLRSMAGRQTGKIEHTITDYKRDIHLDEKYYEKLYLKEYIDGKLNLTAYTYTVSSGMSAFTTILTFLITEQKIKGDILIGKSIYFQNKELIERFFPKQVREVNENKTDEIIAELKKHNPSVIIFDSICNSWDIAMPDLTKILNYLVKNTKKETHLIIDNTSMPIYFQPLKLIKGKNKHLRLFIIESLNKYHQFGMDKTTGGIITAYGKDTIHLYYSRQNSGTNISDISVHMLPKPSRKYLMMRLQRFERNTSFLANSLQEFINQYPKLPFKKINYPTLLNHPSSQWNQKIKFHGSYFSLEFKQGKNNPKTYNKFIKKIIDTAKQNNVQITAGTSFGFNSTRIYLTSLRSDYGTPFVRISVGTDSLYEIEKIKNVFLQTMKNF